MTLISGLRAHRDKLLSAVEARVLAARRTMDARKLAQQLRSEIADLAQQLRAPVKLPSPRSTPDKSEPATAPQPSATLASPQRTASRGVGASLGSVRADGARMFAENANSARVSIAPPQQAASRSPAPRAATPPTPPTPPTPQSPVEDRVTMLLSLTPLGREALRRRKARRATTVEASTLKERRRRELLATSPLGQQVLEQEWRGR